MSEVKTFTDAEKKLQASNREIKSLLWDAYMVMDHGSHDERLEMLNKLENYFNQKGKPE